MKRCNGCAAAAAGGGAGDAQIPAAASRTLPHAAMFCLSSRLNIWKKSFCFDQFQYSTNLSFITFWAGFKYWFLLLRKHRNTWQKFDTALDLISETTIHENDSFAVAADFSHWLEYFRFFIKFSGGFNPLHTHIHRLGLGGKQASTTSGTSMFSFKHNLLSIFYWGIHIWLSILEYPTKI